MEQVYITDTIEQEKAKKIYSKRRKLIIVSHAGNRGQMLIPSVTKPLLYPLKSAGRGL